MWDPQTYLAYAGERTRPARDLLAAVAVTAPARVVDLGCGPGNSTGLLAARWPDADVLGVDLSVEMIAKAQDEASADGRIRYEVGDAGAWRAASSFDDGVDVLYSNALLQWVPGHLALLPAWLADLAPGGRLAFQVPANFEAPSHVLLRAVCDSASWRERLGGVANRHGAVHTPQEYADALAAAGARPDVWETTYLHRLTGPDPVLEWVSGTALRPVLRVLSDDAAARADFLAEYGEALRGAYPPGADGVTTLPFRRIFAVAAAT